MTNAERIKDLRECANWIEAVAASSQYAHDELMALHYGDKLRDAADALEAAEKRIVNLLTALHLANEKLAYVDCQPYTELDGEEMIEDWVKTLVYEELKTQMPKEGKWINLFGHDYKCSVCGEWYKMDGTPEQEDMNYCPNCGARMWKGEQE